MKKLYSRILCLLLSVSLLLPMLGMTAYAEETGSSIPSSTLRWAFDADSGTLTISGEGALPDYLSGWDGSIPWQNIRWQVRTLILSEGVTRIGDYSLTSLQEVKTVELPSTLESIGLHGLSYAGSLQDLTLPAGLSRLGVCAFSNCPNLTLTVLNSNASFDYCAFGFSWSDEAQDDLLDNTCLLRGYEGSTAQSYAESGGIRFDTIRYETITGSRRLTKDEARINSLGITHITNEDELRRIQDNMYGEYVLDNDITLSKPWNSLYGTFGGILNGQGHKISGLDIDAQSQLDAIASFLNILTGTVCNVTFQDVSINSTDNEFISAAPIAARCNGGQIMNCKVSGTILVSAEKTAYVGGLFAYQDSGFSSVENCEVNIEITASAGDGCTAGGISAAPVDRVWNSKVDAAIEVSQDGEEHSPFVFAAYGIRGKQTDSVQNCEVSGSLTATAKDAPFSMAVALENASNSVNYADVTYYSDKADGMAAGGSYAAFCKNYGRIRASAEEGSADLSAFGFVNGDSCENYEAVSSSLSSEEGLAYACGIGNAIGSDSINLGPITAENPRGEAQAYGIAGDGEQRPDNCENRAAINASGKDARAFGVQNCVSSQNNGEIYACGTQPTAIGLTACSNSQNNAKVMGEKLGQESANSFIVGISECSDSVNCGDVTAINGNGCQAFGCWRCENCKNEGVIRAEQNAPLVSSGLPWCAAHGIDESTDCVNTGSVYASITGNVSSTSAAYGYKDSSGCYSSGHISAVNDYYKIEKKGDEMIVSVGAVICAGSTSLHAQVSGAYTVDLNGGSQDVYMYFAKSGGFLGFSDRPSTGDAVTSYYLTTFTSDAAQEVQWQAPEPQPQENKKASVYCETAGFYYEEQEDCAVTSLKAACGSYLFFNGKTPTIFDAETTDNDELHLRVVMSNTGSAESEMQVLKLTLPEGFGFKPDDVQSRTTYVTLDAIAPHSVRTLWVTVYPLYAPEREGNYSLFLDWEISGQESRTQVVSNCYVTQLGEKSNYARLEYPADPAYYGQAAQDTLIFRYFHWQPENFCGDDTLYNREVNRLSSLFSNLVYLAYDDTGDPSSVLRKDQTALRAYAALGFTSIEASGANTTSDCTRIIAKKRFFCDGELRELVMIASVGTMSAEDWIGNFTFSTSDVFHDSFLQCAESSESALQRYLRQRADDLPLRLLITGHSRAAAVSEILADWANNNLRTRCEGIYAYTYAAPLCASGEYADWHLKSDRNIFNFKDFNDMVGFVPGCFSDFGTTWVFDHELLTEYSTYISMLWLISSQPLFRNGNLVRMEYALAKLGVAFATGKLLYYHSMPNYIDSIWDIELQDCISMQSALVKLQPLAKVNNERMQALDAMLSACNLYKKFYKLSLSKELMNSILLSFGKQIVTTLFRMEAGTAANVISTINDHVSEVNGGAVLHINCPVDLKLYDENGILLGEVINDELSDEAEASILVYEDEKTLYLDRDKTYTCQITAYDTGTMDLQFVTYDLQIGEKTCVTNYAPIPVTKSDTFTATLQDGELRVEKADKTAIRADEVLTGNALDTVSIQFAKTDDSVYAMGDGCYTVGERALLIAVSDDETKTFDGWYNEAGELLSISPLASIPCTEDMVIEPRFSSSSAEKECRLQDVSVSKDGVTVRLTATETATLIAAGYTEQGKLVCSALVSVDQKDESAFIPISLETADIYRFFLVRQTDGTPLCEALPFLRQVTGES